MTRSWRQRLKWLVVLPLIAILLLLGVFLTRRKKEPAPDVQLLLCAQPRDLLWDYDTTRKVLHVQCPGIVFFESGELDQSTCTVSTYLMQVDGQGSAGIFLGYGDRNYDAKAMERSIELVGLRRCADGQTPDQYEVFRRTLLILGDPTYEPLWQLSNGRAAPVVYDPSGRKGKLTVIVANGQLARVFWDDKELRSLSGDVGFAGQAKVMATGACGVFSRGGTAKFQHIRVTRSTPGG